MQTAIVHTGMDALLAATHRSAPPPPPPAPDPVEMKMIMVVEVKKETAGEQLTDTDIFTLLESCFGPANSSETAPCGTAGQRKFTKMVFSAADVDGFDKVTISPRQVRTDVEILWELRVAAHASITPVGTPTVPSLAVAKLLSYLRKRLGLRYGTTGIAVTRVSGDYTVTNIVEYC